MTYKNVVGSKSRDDMNKLTNTLYIKSVDSGIFSLVASQLQFNEATGVSIYGHIISETYHDI